MTTAGADRDALDTLGVAADLASAGDLPRARALLRAIPGRVTVDLEDPWGGRPVVAFVLDGRTIAVDVWSEDAIQYEYRFERGGTIELDFVVYDERGYIGIVGNVYRGRVWEGDVVRFYVPTAEARWRFALPGSIGGMAR